MTVARRTTRIDVIWHSTTRVWYDLVQHLTKNLVSSMQPQKEEVMDEASKYGALFADSLRYTEMSDSVRVVGTQYDDWKRLLDVEVSVSDLTDWSLRYAVLGFASRFEEAESVQVRCFFRASSVLDPALSRL